jgi:hypothetical protein
MMAHAPAGNCGRLRGSQQSSRAKEFTDMPSGSWRRMYSAWIKTA